MACLHDQQRTNGRMVEAYGSHEKRLPCRGDESLLNNLIVNRSKLGEELETKSCAC